jgi:hypothetical protein
MLSSFLKLHFNAAAAITAVACCPCSPLQERDPRWLVQHRDDGKNVNGWHWEEKNRLEWTKQRLRELLPAIPAAEPGNLRISEVTDVVGEVRLGDCCYGVKPWVTWLEQ